VKERGARSWNWILREKGIVTGKEFKQFTFQIQEKGFQIVGVTNNTFIRSIRNDDAEKGVNKIK